MKNIKFYEPNGSVISHAVPIIIEDRHWKLSRSANWPMTGLLVRNGDHPERDIQTGMGPVVLNVPKVGFKQGQAITIVLSRFRPIY